MLDVSKRIEGINVGRVKGTDALFRQCAAAYTEHRPGVVGLARVVANCFELHAVRVEGEHNFGMPHDFGAVFAQYLQDSVVGKVAFARCGKAAVERDAELACFGVTLGILFGGAARSHGMAGRRTLADAVEFAERFHVI